MTGLSRMSEEARRTAAFAPGTRDIRRGLDRRHADGKARVIAIFLAHAQPEVEENVGSRGIGFELQEHGRLERADLPGADRFARRPDDGGRDMIEKMAADAGEIGENRDAMPAQIGGGTEA